MEEYSDKNNSNNFVKYILYANCFVFVCQEVCKSWFRSFFFEEFFSLSMLSISKGYLWTIFTYSFLHGNFTHLFFNSILIFFAGKSINTNTIKTAIIYTISVLLGGLFWLSINLSSPGILLGSSAGAIGLLIFFCRKYPLQQIILFLFFIIPIKVKPKFLAIGLIVYEIASCLLYEIHGKSLIANSAHLGGILGGLLMFELYKSHIFEKLTFRKNNKKKILAIKFEVNLEEHRRLKLQLDNILDKISKEGFQSLSEEEKTVLKQCKNSFEK